MRIETLILEFRRGLNNVLLEVGLIHGHPCIAGCLQPHLQQKPLVLQLVNYMSSTLRCLQHGSAEPLYRLTLHASSAIIVENFEVLPFAPAIRSATARDKQGESKFSCIFRRLQKHREASLFALSKGSLAENPAIPNAQTASLKLKTALGNSSLRPRQHTIRLATQREEPFPLFRVLGFRVLGKA